MKKKNELRNIAGQEILLSSEAAVILDTYLSAIRKKYRLYRKPFRELQEALRDTLVSYQAKPSVALSKQKTEKALALVGETYEGQSHLGKIFESISRYTPEALKAFKRHVIRKRTLTFICYGVSLLFIGTTVWVAAHSAQYVHSFYIDTISNDSGANILPTTIGDVQLHDRYNVAAKTIPAPSFYGLFFSIVGTLVLGAIFFALLARKHKYWKVVGVLFGISLVVWLSLANIAKRDDAAYGYKLRAQDAAMVEVVNQTRTINDVDLLRTCGAHIRYAMSDDLFYEFREAGYKLAHEFESASTTGEPAHDDLCSTYNNLRKTYPNENIVLQNYIIDDNGERRPQDGQEIYVGLGTPTVHINKFRYGFFVKEK